MRSGFWYLLKQDATAKLVMLGRAVRFATRQLELYSHQCQELMILSRHSESSKAKECRAFLGLRAQCRSLSSTAPPDVPKGSSLRWDYIGIAGELPYLALLGLLWVMLGEV